MKKFNNGLFFLIFIISSQILRAQTWDEIVNLTASDAGPVDRFGHTVSIDGDRAIVGAFLNDAAVDNAGAAYIYELSGGVWTETIQLTASDAANADLFGYSVSIDGDLAIVGAYENDDDGSGSGAAYIFEFSGGTWTETTKLTASDADIDDNFGWTVEIDGNRAIVGSYHNNDDGSGSGSAYIFELAGGVWTEMVKLTASDAATGDNFGARVSIDGDKVIVGSPFNDDAGSASGSAYIFELVAGVWTETAKLTASDADDGDNFGWSISISGDVAIAGAFSNDDAGNDSGSAYVYELSGGVWTETIKLTASDADAFDNFGSSVSVDGNLAIVSGPRNSDDGALSGSAYIFELAGGVWSEQAKLNASDALAEDFFGFSVAIDGSRVLIGALGNDDDGSFSGSAYIFDLDCPIPVLPIVTETEICIGESVTFTGSGASSYTWDMGVTDGLPFTPVTTGTTTYTVTGTFDDGCERTASVDVTVHDLPGVVANVSDNEICIGESVVFTGTGAVSYIWDMGVVDGGEFTPDASGTITYTVMGESAAGCENSGSVDVTVHDLPDVMGNVSDDEICVGESVVFTGAGAASYTWDMGVVDGGEFTSVDSGTLTYTVIGESAAGCENSASVDVTVHDLPDVMANVSNDEICIDESVVFTGAGATSYTWDMEVVDGDEFTPDAPGMVTYTVIGESVAGCENSASVDVTVHDLPEVMANVSDDEICIGESVVFTGAGAVSYTWDMGIIDGESFTPDEAGAVIYSVTGESSEGCENSASIVVIVNHLPGISISTPSGEICLGESIVFSVAGAASYSWDMGIVEGEPFTPVESGVMTYTAIGESAAGCVNSGSIDITIHDLPDVMANVSEDEICLDESVVFSGSGALTYVWDMEVVDGDEFTPEALGVVTYTVIGLSVEECENSASVDVTVHDLPDVMANVSDDEICIGESVVFTGAGAVSYTWDMGIIDEESFTPDEAGTVIYTLMGESVEGCENSASIEVTIHNLPVVIATASSDNICFEESVIFSVEGATEYAWIPEGVETGTPYYPTETGEMSYTVIGTDVNGCEGIGMVGVTMLEAIEISYVTNDELLGADGLIDLSVTGGMPLYAYDWDNDGTGDFDDSEDLTDLMGGTYFISILDAAGCELSESITVESQLGVNEGGVAQILLYPNPTNADIVIEVAGKFRYELFSIVGVKLEDGLGYDKTKINLGDYVTGTYLIKVNSDNGTALLKFVKN